jgi:hypothetical protein
VLRLWKENGILVKGVNEQSLQREPPVEAAR